MQTCDLIKLYLLLFYFAQKKRCDGKEGWDVSDFGYHTCWIDPFMKTSSSFSMVIVQGETYRISPYASFTFSTDTVFTV